MGYLVWVYFFVAGQVKFNHWTDFEPLDFLFFSYIVSDVFLFLLLSLYLFFTFKYVSFSV